MRSARDLSGRQLAEVADLSHTQISRIETGATAVPSAETLRRLAGALNFNYRPLLVLAGHLEPEQARAELTSVVEEHQGAFEFWEMDITLEQARRILADPASTPRQLAELAKELALWVNADEESAGDPEPEEDPRRRRLLDLWRLLADRRREELLDYAEALQRLQAMEFSVAHRQLLLQGSQPSPHSSEGQIRPFSEADLRRRGFEGFVPIGSLLASTDGVPATAGVYAVVRLTDEPPQFLAESVGGHYQGKSPTRPVEKLQDAWLPSQTLYLGKADAKKNPLRTRLRTLARFGQGNPAAAHRGGSSIWQLADHAELRVCWLVTADPAGVELELVDEFSEEYGAMPFANLQRPSGR